METLAKRALLGALKFQAVLAVLIFAPALSLTFWQGWLYWFVFLACVLATTLCFLRHDPALVERRMRAACALKIYPRLKNLAYAARILAR